MKVRDLITTLMAYNMDADVQVIDDESIGRDIKFYGYGSSDGCTKQNCEDVSFSFSDSKPKVEVKSENGFKGFTKEQIKWIQDSIGKNYSTNDIIYNNFGKETFGCFVLSTINGRPDIVSVNIGFYSKGKFYYNPIRDGRVVEFESVLLPNAVACIKFD